MSEIKNRNEIADKYKWDLSSLFKSDEDFEKALSSIDEEIEELTKYQGTLNNADTILEYLNKEMAVGRKMNNIYNYSSLLKNSDTTDEKAQSMNGRAMSKMVKLTTATVFSEPEILSLSKEELEKIVSDEKLKDYKFFLEKLINRKEHTLDFKEERIMASMSELMGAPGEISGYLMDADMKFDAFEDSKGNKHELSGANYILYQSSEDRTLRENAFRSYYKTFKDHNNTLASTYANAVKAATIEASLRNYKSSKDMVMSRADIPAEVYDNLVNTVHKHMKTMHEYVSLRKRLLGVDELHYYDVYAPLVSNIEEHYDYEQAQEIILDALKPLGSEYTDVVKSAFANRWIDVYPNKGKRGGAFSSGTYDSNPYILCNYTGTLDSVSTIAHEMGHSMHSYLSHKHQLPQYGRYTLFVAEVASTVNENLLIERLLSKEEDLHKRLSLLNQYLENFKGTVYRQTMFAEFEKKVHELYEAGTALTPSLLNSIYKQLIVEYFGEDLVVDDEVQYEWSRIPHFYRPFYVYVYATGYSSAVAISEMILKQGEEKVKSYLEFLSMGGSAYPLDELKHAGVDLTIAAPIDMALDKFEAVLNEAKEIADKLGL